MSAVCSQAAGIKLTGLPDSAAGCEDCLTVGRWWVRRRMCQTGGRPGCCGSSPTRHASRHARTGGHPMARSAEPGKEWSWCNLGNAAFLVEGHEPATAVPGRLAREAAEPKRACSRAPRGGDAVTVNEYEWSCQDSY